MRKRLTVKSAKTNPPIPPFAKGGVEEITKLSLRADRSNPKHYTVKDEQGFVLVVALLALLVVTVIGVLALSTSTTEVMVAGNMRLREINFSRADSGLEITSPTLRYILGNLTFGNYGTIVNDPNLAAELRSGTAFDTDSPSPSSTNFSPDLILADFGGPNLDVNIDIDRMFSGACPGSALEFASGYEGIGLGGGGSTCAYYRVNSVGSGDIGSENVVGGVYRYVAY